MKRKLILITLIITVILFKLIYDAYELKNETEQATMNTESEPSGTVGNEDSELVIEQSEKIVTDTNTDKLELNDIDELTIDAKDGSSCNEYIPELVSEGYASYIISPENDMFSYFCSQTIGGDDFNELDDTGATSLPLIMSYFNATYSFGATEYVSMGHLDSDVYVACVLDIFPSEFVESVGEYRDQNCMLTTIDSHEYFYPQKEEYYVPGEEHPYNYMTDAVVLDSTYWTYVDDFGQVSTWYANNNIDKVDEFIDTLPPEDELNLEVVDYDFLMSVLKELQDNVRNNFEG